MKLFLRKVVSFAACYMLVFGALFAGLYVLYGRRIGHYHLSDKISRIFIGDSHVSLAVDPALIPGSVNFSVYSEPPEYSYFKLKAMLRNSRVRRKVYLGFGPHTVSSYYHDFIVGEFSAEVAQRYFFLLPYQEQRELLSVNWKQLPQFSHHLFMVAFSNAWRREDRLSFLGTYQNLFTHTAARTGAMDKRLALQYYRDGQLRGISGRNVAYLHRIAALCKAHNAELILLNTPLHPYYRSRIPPAFFRAFAQVSMPYNVLDLAELPMDDSCYMMDGDHVSARGAAITTRHILQ